MKEEQTTALKAFVEEKDIFFVAQCCVTRLVAMIGGSAIVYRYILVCAFHELCMDIGTCVGNSNDTAASVQRILCNCL